MAKEFILRENVLTDDTLCIAGKGRMFKGGYVAIIKAYKYLNAWNDKLVIKKFKKADRLLSFIDKEYPEAAEFIDLQNTCIE